MDLAKLKYILTIAEEKSISKASIRLFLSQPYLSKVLSETERSLNVKLFNRDKVPLELTPSGERYVKYINDLIHLKEDMRNDLLKLNDRSDEHFFFGIPSSRGSYIIPIVMPQFKTRYPEVNVVLEEKHYPEILEGLMNKHLHIGIISYTTYPDVIIHEPVKKEKILLVLPPNHPLGRPDALGKYNTPIPFDERQLPLLKNDTCIITNKSLSIGIITRTILEKKNLNSCPHVETSNMDTVYRLTLNEVGFSFLPASCIRSSPLRDSAYYFTIGSPPLEWTQVIAYRHDTKITPAMRYFMDLTKVAFDSAS